MSESSRNHQEHLTEKQQIILEIGHSTRSLAEHSQLAFNNGLTYIGLELPENNYVYDSHLEFNQNSIDEYRSALKASKPGENIQFITGDARELPFASESVDTVFMANVFDSPLHAETPNNFDRLLLSIRKVLKPDGKAVIFEDRSPIPNGSFHDAKKLQLELLGFDVSEQIGTQDSELFEAMRERYGMHMNTGNLVPLLDKSYQKAIGELKKKNPDWSPGPSKAMSGDYFMILSKSNNEPEIIPGETPNSWKIAEKAILEEEMRKAGLSDYLNQKKRLEQMREEAAMKAERRREIAIMIGRGMGRAALKGTKRIIKAISA